MNEKNPGTVFAESYIHLKPYEIKSSDKEFLLNIRQKVILKAKDYYKSDLFLVPEIEEGSLKSKLTLLGALYIAIGEYGDFRSGIKQLYQDAQVVTEFINNEIIEHINPNKNSLFHTERRTGVPGRIRRILKDLDYLSNNLTTLSNSEIEDSLKSIKHRLVLTLQYSNNTNDKRLIIESIKRETERNFPQNTNNVNESIYAWKRELEFLIIIEDDEEFERIIERKFLN